MHNNVLDLPNGQNHHVRRSTQTTNHFMVRGIMIQLNPIQIGKIHIIIAYNWSVLCLKTRMQIVNTRTSLIKYVPTFTVDSLQTDSFYTISSNTFFSISKTFK